jgi:hypothetical protein
MFGAIAPALQLIPITDTTIDRFSAQGVSILPQEANPATG